MHTSVWQSRFWFQTKGSDAGKSWYIWKYHNWYFCTIGSWCNIRLLTVLFLDELWKKKKSSLNPQGMKDVISSHLPSHWYILKWVGESLPPVELVMLWYIKSTIVEYLPSSYKSLLGLMPSSKWIDIKKSKSTQQPACAMHIKASSNDGNIKIVENLGCQLGTKSEWCDSYVHLCHGDLGTEECHDSTRFFHAIENSSQNRLQLWQYPVYSTSGWQLLMLFGECTLVDHAVHSNEGGTYKLFETLCPWDFSKLNSSNPSYCMLNDGIMHLIKAHITVCWEQTLGYLNLQDFARTESTWDVIDNVAHQILTEHFAGNSFEDLQDWTLNMIGSRRTKCCLIKMAWCMCC